jgi:hypothetical protein
LVSSILASPASVGAQQVEPEREPPSYAALGRDAGLFAQGRARVSLVAGTGASLGDDYLMLGAGLGYYVLDGLEIGVDYEAWLFNDPIVQRLSPGARYVFHFVPAVKPYVGGFYRHAFVSGDIDDLDYAGARAGIYFVPPAERISFGAGAVYERVLDCDELFVDCDSFYPEISFSLAL